MHMHTRARIHTHTRTHAHACTHARTHTSDDRYLVGRGRGERRAGKLRDFLIGEESLHHRPRVSGHVLPRPLLPRHAKHIDEIAHVVIGDAVLGELDRGTLGAS